MPNPRCWCCRKILLDTAYFVWSSFQDKQARRLCSDCNRIAESLYDDVWRSLRKHRENLTRRRR